MLRTRACAAGGSATMSSPITLPASLRSQPMSTASMGSTPATGGGAGCEGGGALGGGDVGLAPGAGYDGEGGGP
jgi:hypothetical protein